jgi:hypothetical protein
MLELMQGIAVLCMSVAITALAIGVVNDCMSRLVNRDNTPLKRGKKPKHYTTATYQCEECKQGIPMGLKTYNVTYCSRCAERYR